MPLRLSSILCLILISACGNRIISANPEPSCDGVVQLGIYDDGTEILCGCNEASGTQAFGTDTLTCTFSQGTPIHYFFLGFSLSQQVNISLAGDSVYIGPLYDPDDDHTPRAGTVTLESTGTHTLNSRHINVTLEVL